MSVIYDYDLIVAQGYLLQVCVDSMLSAGLFWQYER